MATRPDETEQRAYTLYCWWAGEVKNGRIDVTRDFHWLLADLASLGGQRHPIPGLDPQGFPMPYDRTPR